VSKRQCLLCGIGNRFFRPARRAFPCAASQQGGDLSLEAVTAEHEAAIGARPEGIDPGRVERLGKQRLIRGCPRRWRRAQRKEPTLPQGAGAMIGPVDVLNVALPKPLH